MTPVFFWTVLKGILSWFSWIWFVLVIQVANTNVVHIPSLLHDVSRNLCALTHRVDMDEWN